MSNRFCTKCGKEVVADKRFCGGCGQAMPILATQAQPVLVATPEAAAPSCVQCGTALIPGKRFCRQCGHAVGESAPVPEPVVAPAAAAMPSSPVCVQCGESLAPGVRFCKRCGHAIGAAAPVVPVKAVQSVQGVSPIREATVVDLPLAAPVVAPDETAPIPDGSALAQEPDAARSADARMETTRTPAWDSAEAGSALQQPSSAVNVSPTSPGPLPEPPGQSKAKIGVIFGIAAAVLVLAAAGGGWAWYAHSHRNAPSAGKTPNVQQQPTVTSPAQDKGGTATPEQANKPSAGIPASHNASAPQPQSNSGAATPPHPPPAIAAHDFAQHADKATTPQPAIAPSSPPAPAPAATRTGMLHYQGPPVPHNGMVVFDHLPHARLKFTFDHQAWSVTIKPNPDGTKRVTLISQAPGYQTICDLGWEIIE